MPHEYKLGNAANKMQGCTIRFIFVTLQTQIQDTYLTLT